MINKIREAQSYPMMEIIRVTPADVDMSIYFPENVGVSIKTIIYKDINANILKKEFFTYMTSSTDVNNVYSIDNDNCLGLLTGTTVGELDGKKVGDFYIVPVDITIDGNIYSKDEKIGLVEGATTNYWKKVTIDSNGDLVASE